MSAIISATATFRPTAMMEKFVDLYVQARLFGAVRASQGIVADEARACCPVETGELAGSIAPGEITIGGGQIIGPVVAAAGHAAFVEFGTGLRGAGTYPWPLPQENVPYTGSWVYDYKQQGWKGMPSQPYLRPALDVARDQVLAEFTQA